MAAYYNENDLKIAAWLRELIKAGLIADGEVDTRSIVDVRPDDLRGLVQCHFFAGIGGWSYALRLAGWPDDRECWTGSCPCQPFSSAGTQAGGNDPRDLWPAWFKLIAECRPSVIFGEQVESAIGHGWLDRLHNDLETEGYAVGPAGLPSAGVGAFDIRQRLWFVADAMPAGRPEGWPESGDRSPTRGRGIEQLADSMFAASERRAGSVSRAEAASGDGRGEAGRMADAEYAERRTFSVNREDGCDGSHCGRPEAHGESGARGEVCELGDTDDARSQGRLSGWQCADERAPWAPSLVEWIPCRDGKWRPVESGTFPLAHGIPARLGRLRGYGNAINPWVAKEVIGAYMDICDEGTVNR